MRPDADESIPALLFLNVGWDEGVNSTWCVQVRKFFEPYFKIPLNPPFSKGMMTVSPFSKGELEGIFKNYGSIGVIQLV